MAPTILTTVASFPRHYFLENLVVRRDNSLLISSMLTKELWYVPPVTGKVPVSPILVHTYAEPAMGIVELEDDIFYMHTGNIYTTHECYLHRIDLRQWTPGTPIHPVTVCRFPEQATGVNGSCIIANNVILVADCFSGLIWRVDIPIDGGAPKPRVWLKHPTMNHDPNSGAMADCPGVNGVQFCMKNSHLYYTSTLQRLFCRVRVDSETLEPVGEPEILTRGFMGDDFLIDEDAGVAYVTTHRQNTIERIPLEPGEETVTVVGKPWTEQLVGPTNGVWGRLPGEKGHVAYFITDGGTKAPPPDGIVRPALLLQVKLDTSDSH